MDRKGRVAQYIESFTWSYFDPHSTQKKGRSCESCHQNPKSLGLGYGKVFLRKGDLYFEPLEKRLTSTSLRLSQVISEKGETSAKFNRPNMSGLKKEEIFRILRVGICLECHKEKDKIYRQWKSKISCPKFPNL
ncbi:MAG: hypothetical protein ACK4Y7_03620 [Caldimicrobium sp.]